MKIKGRPLMGKNKKLRHQVMLDPSITEAIRKIGKGNLSAGIAALERKRDVDILEVGVQKIPVTLAEAILCNQIALINVHGELFALNERTEAILHLLRK